jgi:Ser/Thr protein kinase RdoA (MazF antagonist)
MMAPTQPDYLPFARSALAQYPLHNTRLTFLGHSDNLTFRVDEPGGSVYLLRLHTPVVSFLHGVRQQPEAIASELTWMEALALEGGFTIQRPIHTYNSSLVGSVEIDGSAVPCTLLTWLEGEHFSLNLPDAKGILRSFGTLVARMHDFSAHWQPPAGFLRPSYDEIHFRRVFGRFSRGVDHEVYSEVVNRQLQIIGQAILDVIQNLPSDPDHWGMTHNDLHVGNFLVNQGQVIPIDFSFCGPAHYLFDLSVPLAGGMKADLRPVFLEGYNAVRPLVQADIRAIEAYALAGRLSYYAYQIDNPTERDWLRRRIPQIIENEGALLLRGKPLLMNL